MAENEAFKAIRDIISSALAAVTQTTRQLTNEDLPFHRSANPGMATLLDSQASKILSVAQALTKVSTAGTTVAAPRLQDVESIEDGWQDIGDLIDHLLENADACIDEYQGAIKRLSPSREAQIPVDPPARKTFAIAKAWNSVDIPKPQLLFAKRPVDDQSPFKPFLRTKPHASVPLEESIRPEVGENGLEQYDKQFRSFHQLLGYFVTWIDNQPQIQTSLPGRDYTVTLPLCCTRQNWADSFESSRVHPGYIRWYLWRVRGDA